MRKILACIFFSVCTVAVTAQGLTNAPTSMFGIGEIATGEGGQMAGMGGIGLALRKDNFINIANPASLTELAKERFQIDAGVKGVYQAFTKNHATNKSLSGNMNNISMGCKIYKNWYGALFIVPVSSVGYTISLDEEIIGSSGSTITSLFEGDGGLSKIGFSTAYAFGKHLSIGANFSYVTGKISYSETQGTSIETSSSRKTAFYADFGLQYKWDLDQERFVVIGAVYGHFKDFHQTNNLYVYNSSASSTIDEGEFRYRQCLPQFYGGGVSYNTQRWLVSAEFKYYNWDRMRSSVSYVRFQNQYYASIGGKYILDNVYRSRYSVLGGLGVNNQYIIVNSRKATEYYISGGLNLGLRNNNVLAFGLKYKGQFSAPNGMQRQSSVALFINITFSERTYRAKIQ